MNATNLGYALFRKLGISPSFFEYERLGVNFAVAKADKELGYLARHDAIFENFQKNNERLF